MKFNNKNQFLSRINYNLDGYLHPYAVIPIERRQKWRRSILTKDKFRCKICGTKNHLVAHHIIFKHYYPELQFVTNNGITLCKPCEDQAHGRELSAFIPKHVKVPSLKRIMISRQRLLPLRIRMIRKIKSWIASVGEKP